MKKVFVIMVMIFSFTIFGCDTEISEEGLKDFVVEYDDALSKGWSESDEIFVPEVTKKYVSNKALLDHYSNKRWFIYSDDIQIVSIKKLPEEEFEYFGKNSYQIIYKQKVIGKIEDNLIIPLHDSENYGRQSVCVSKKNGKIVVTSYAYGSCWVKVKHLPALIKRKGLVYAD